MSYSNGLLSDQSYQTANKYVQRGLPGVGFKLTDTGDYDMQNKKLVNVDEGDNNHDVVNKHQLDVGLQTKSNKTDVLLLDGTTHMVGDLDLRGNKIILPGEIDMDQKLITNLDTNENQDLSAVNMITLKNKVEPKADKDYVDFEITKQNALINNTFVKKTGDQMTGDLILPHYNYPVQGNTNKAISYETQREIFISRKETFPMETSLDMNNNVIENVATPTSSHQATNKGYCDYNFLNRQKGGVMMGALSMNRNDLIGIPDTPKFGYSAVNKNYVDGKIPSVDSTQFVKKAGDLMIGDLDMGSHFVKNVGINLSDDSTVVPRSYVDSFANSAIHNPLERDLFANNHQIQNLKTPSEDNDAVNKKYFENQLLESHLLPSHRENAFEYLFNVDESSSENNIVVQGIVDFNQSPHKNKKAYSITIIKDSGSNDYRSRIGMNIYPLDIGFYTIIMEYYWPENTNIQLSCQATTAWINKQASKDFPDYTKLLVQFKQTSKDTPDRLFFNIHGEAVVSNPEGYLTFYGMKGWFDSVNPRIYDSVIEESMFQWKNNEMSINTDIDMQNHRLKNLPLPTDDDDAASKIYIDKINTAIQKKLILDFFHNTKDFAYKSTFGDGFYDLIESIFYHLKQNVSGIVIDKIMPNLFLETDRFIADYNPKYGLKLSTKSHVKVGKIFDQNNSFTFFMSFLHDNTKTGEISFSNTLNSHIKFYPRYRITSNKLIIDYQSGTYETQFTNDFQNKRLFIWICFDGSQNLYKMALSNYPSHISETFNPPVNFFSCQFEIDYDVFVNKIGFTDKFIDIDNMEFHRIILEEKRNGSYL